MPVIINDFEIVAQNPPGRTAGNNSSSNNTADHSAASAGIPIPPTPRALDIRRVQEHQIRRKLRLYTH